MSQSTIRQRQGVASAAKIEGGFRILSTQQVCMVWTAYRTGLLTRFLDVRVYWALHEIADRREAALRAKKRTAKNSSPFRWPRGLLLQEVRQLVQLTSVAPIRASLSRLESCGLVILSPDAIRFAEKMTGLADPLSRDATCMLHRIHSRPNVRERSLALPRRMLRYLAANGMPSFHATVLAHLVRCVWRQGTSYSFVGRCSSAFVSCLFGVDPRNVKRARGLLRGVGWLMNADGDAGGPDRLGPWASVNLAWAGTEGATCRVAPPLRAGSPPLTAPRVSTSPPPNTQHDLPSGSKKNQYLRPGGMSGLRKRSDPAIPPTLDDVQPADLSDPRRLRALFDDAVRRGLLRECVADRARLVTAAAHAVRIGTRNPCGLFVSVLRRQLWSYLSQADEDAARGILAHSVWQEEVETTLVPMSRKVGPSSGGEADCTNGPSHLIHELVQTVCQRWSRMPGADSFGHAQATRLGIRTKRHLDRAVDLQGSRLSACGSGPGRPSLVPTRGASLARGDGVSQRPGLRTGLARPELAAPYSSSGNEPIRTADDHHDDHEIPVAGLNGFLMVDE